MRRFYTGRRQRICWTIAHRDKKSVLSEGCKMSIPESHPADPIHPPQFIGLLLLSLATLLLELALTRVLSVSLWYHFGFLVISTALLGFGASGVTLALWTRMRERADLGRSLAACSLCFACSTLLSFWLMQRIPFDPFSIAVSTETPITERVNA
jgi:hypothetical protein